MVKTIDLVDYMPEGVVVANQNTKLNLDIEIETPIEKDIKISVDNIEIKRLSNKVSCDIVDKEYTLKLKGYEEDLKDIEKSDIGLVLDLEYSTKGSSKELLVELYNDTIEIVSIPIIEYTLN